MNKPGALRWAGRASVVLVAIALVEYLVLPRFIGLDRIVPLVKTLSFTVLGLALAVEAAALVSYSCLTRAMLPPQRRPRLGTLFRVDLTTFGFSHVAPVSGITANALRYRLLTETGVRRSDALFATVVQGIGSAVVLNVMLWIGMVITVARGGAHSTFGAAVLAGACLLTAVAAVLLAFTSGRPWTVRLVRAVAARLPRTNADLAEKWLRRTAEHLTAMGRDRRLLGRAVGWAVANWLLDAVVLWVLLLDLGVGVDLVRLFVAYGLANVMGVLPLTPGGVGVVEGLLVPGLVGAGVPADSAVLAVLAWRLINFWLPIPAAAVSYLSLRAGRLLTHRPRQHEAVPGPRRP